MGQELSLFDPPEEKRYLRTLISVPEDHQVPQSSRYRQKSGSIPALRIGYPTNFQHAVHVKHDKASNVYQDFPDVWRDVLPEYAESCASKRTSIGKPFNVSHHIHVQKKGLNLEGLPTKWKQMLKQAGISDEQLHQHESAVSRALLAHGKNRIELRRKERGKNSWSQFNRSSSNPAPPGDPLRKSSAPELGFRSSLDRRITRHSPPALPPKNVGSGSQHSIYSRKPEYDTSLRFHVRNKSLDSGSVPPEDVLLREEFADVISQDNPEKLYRRKSRMFEGSRGTVFDAVNVKTLDRVAIKVISRVDSDRIETLHNELLMMILCRHRNIVRFSGSYISNQSLWTVSEFMDYGTLTDLIASRPSLETAAVGRILKEVLKAIAYLHEEGKIHRDIRSDNILLNSRGEVKLSDFGCCVDITLKRNSVVGTPNFMAPELIGGLDYDEKVDIWSLGMTLFEMIQGDPPFICYPSLKVMFVIATEGAPAIEEFPCEELRSFYSECTRYDSSARSAAFQLLSHPLFDHNYSRNELAVALDSVQI